MSQQKVMQLSIALPGIAEKLHEQFAHINGGEPICFVMVTNAHDVSQYVSNMNRDEGIKMLREVLSRMEAGFEDIPAHLNPEVQSYKKLTPCYQCGAEVTYLFGDSRCSKCTRVDPYHG